MRATGRTAHREHTRRAPARLALGIVVPIHVAHAYTPRTLCDGCPGLPHALCTGGNGHHLRPPPHPSGTQRLRRRTIWSPPRHPCTLWSWASASIATSSGEPSHMAATALEHLPRSSVLRVASFSHTAVSFCKAQSSCIMLCSMHGCALDTPWHYPCSLGPRPPPGGGPEESTVWPRDIACTSLAR